MNDLPNPTPTISWTRRSRPRTSALLAALAALAAAPGCSCDDGEDTANACAFARDGVCDEPANCALGTDSADCTQACAAKGSHALFAAACAWRAPAPPAGYPDAVPSGGAGGLTGHIDGTVPAPSGEDASREVERDYRLYVPASYDPSRAWPLVVSLGGHRVDHRDLAGYTQLVRSADLNGFIVAFAAQEFRSGRYAWWTDWSWADRKAENPDLIFLRRLAGKLAGLYNLDRSRVFLSGHSRGAAMSLIGALELPDLIAGAAVESGFTEFNYLATVTQAPPRRVPLVFVHGTDDPDVCIDCRPQATCTVTGNRCGAGMHASDAIVEKLRGLGWLDDQDLVYYRLEHVTHRWQDPLNQQWWDFLAQRPLPLGCGATRSALQRRPSALASSEAVALPASGPRQKRPTAPEVDPASTIAFEASQFTMGTGDLRHGPYGQSWFVNEQPAHPVRLAAFSLDRTEVTVEAFAQFLSYAGGEAFFSPAQPIERVDGGFLARAGAEREPIRHVTWTAAEAFCAWAGKRLPTEAEWERAAAGLDGREFPWGNDGPSCARTVYFTGASFCARGPQPVGSRHAGATPEGIEDLAGNVAEWVSDRYGDYTDGEVEDPSGALQGSLRVVRGGSWLEWYDAQRTRARWGAAPDRGSAGLGFRCAWSGSTDDGALRGALAAVPDVGRQPSSAPAVRGAALPEILGEGLAEPGPMVRLGERIFILERGRGDVVVVGSGGPQVVATGFAGAVGMASDGQRLYVTERDGGRVDAVDPDSGAVQVLAQDEAAPSLLAADAAGVVWVASGQLRACGAGGVRGLGAPIAGVTALALSPEAVLVATDGGGVDTAAAVLRIARDSGESSVLFDAIAADTLPSHVTWAAAENAAYVLVRYREGQQNGWMHRVAMADGRHRVVSYTPAPLDVPAVVVGEQVYWATRTSLLRIDTSAPMAFDTLAPWTRAGGFVVFDGQIVWADGDDGRVYKVRR